MIIAIYYTDNSMIEQAWNQINLSHSSEPNKIPSTINSYSVNEERINYCMYTFRCTPLYLYVCL